MRKFFSEGSLRMVIKMPITMYSGNSSWDDYVLVDDEDYNKCKHIKWRKYPEHKQYVNVIGYDESGNRLSLGRLLFDLPSEDKEHVVVLKNTNDPLNYTRSNLQVVDRKYKSRNATKTWGKSKYKGVSWDTERQKWKVVVRRKGKTLFSKRFDDENEAADAYVNAVKDIDAE